MEISQAELKEKISQLKGNGFVGLTTVTEAATVKNPYGKIMKLSRQIVNTGFSYENAVNNQAKREGSEVKFKPHQRVWGKHVTQSLIEHNGNFYLEAKPEKSRGHKYFYHDSTGKIHLLTKSQVQNYLKQSKKPNTQDFLKQEVRIRDYKLESIRKISVNKEKLSLI